MSLWGFEGERVPRAPLTVSAVIAAGVHLFPFRTEQLSPPAPMVLGAQAPGRVGRRRIILKAPLGQLKTGRAFVVSRRAELVAPVRVERAQPPYTLGDGRMRDEERRDALL